MIAYSSQWLEALQVRRQAATWHRKNLINAVQLETILKAHPVEFYTPNVFVRIGLAIFCWVLMLSAMGVFGALLFSSSEVGTGVMLLLFGAGTLVGLEYVIRENRHYRSGIDDMLLYMALGFIVSGFALMLSLYDAPLALCLVALPVVAFGAVRYLDRLVTVAAFLCSSAIVFLTVLETGSIGRLVLPFVLMAYAAAGYFGVRRLKGRPALRLWSGCLDVLEGLCLLTFYVSGNYFVIQVLSDVMFNQPDVPMAFVFYAFTALVPVLYLVFGLRQRDRLMLRAGMVLLALTVLTFRYYFSLGHPEIMVTVAGAVLVVFAYVAIRLLKRGDLPFTYAQDAEEPEEGQELESFIVSETFARSAQGPVPVGENPFGGGQFGGGGSGGNY